MQLFFLPNISPNAAEGSFDEEESRHICKTLRKQIGDRIHITDGQGTLFAAKILDNHFKKCSFVVEKSDFFPPETPHIHLAVAPTKAVERFEWLVEKASEAGAARITPVYCEHSERTHLKPERLQKIAVGAMKQSLRYYLPIIDKAIHFKEFMTSSLHGSQKFIAHCMDGHKQPLQAAKPITDATILIGPEGDFTTSELELALEKSFIPISLGRARLRTETAALAACFIASLGNERL